MARDEEALRRGGCVGQKSLSAQPAAPVCKDVLQPANGHRTSCGYSGTLKYKHHSYIHDGNRRGPQETNSKIGTATMLTT